MEIETYSHTCGSRLSQEGLCIQENGFIAKRNFRGDCVYLALPHNKDSLV